MEVKRLQYFSAFDESECGLAMRLIAAAADEEAAGRGALEDSATEAFATSLGRLRRRAFPASTDGAWRDGDLAGWTWTAPLRAAADDVSREVAALENQSVGWDGAEYTKIAADWSFLSLWRGGAFTEAALAMPATKRALERAMDLGLRLHPLQAFAAGVARMPGGSTIAEHCDGGLLSYTAHLGLRVPDGCRLVVGGEARPWRNGEWLAFDPSWPHSATNPQSSDRYVLLLQPLRDEVEDEDVAAVAHFLDPRTLPPPPRGAAPFWLERETHVVAHSTWHGANATHVDLGPRAIPRRVAELVYPAPADLGAFRARPGCPPFREAPFADARSSARPPPRRGDVLRPAYVAVDDAGGVDWIAVADASLDHADVLRDPRVLDWLPEPHLDHVAPDEPAAGFAPRRRPKKRRR